MTRMTRCRREYFGQGACATPALMLDPPGTGWTGMSGLQYILAVGVLMILVLVGLWLVGMWVGRRDHR